MAVTPRTLLVVYISAACTVEYSQVICGSALLQLANELLSWMGTKQLAGSDFVVLLQNV